MDLDSMNEEDRELVRRTVEDGSSGDVAAEVMGGILGIVVFIVLLILGCCSGA
jgi:hypothetical protein